MDLHDADARFLEAGGGVEEDFHLASERAAVEPVGGGELHGDCHCEEEFGDVDWVGEVPQVNTVDVGGECFGVEDGVDSAVSGLVLGAPAVASGPVWQKKFKVGVGCDASWESGRERVV